MKAIFGVVGLLVVVAIVGLVARRNLQAVQTATGGAPVGMATPVAPPTPQRQVTGDVNKALEAGAQRSRDAAEGAR